MPKPYDATTRLLVELRPIDWVRFLQLPEGPVTLLDADLSTVTSAADRLIRVDAPSGPYILHNEFETGKNTASLPPRLVHYSAGAHLKYRLPIVTTVFLLYPGADSPQVTGRYQQIGPDGTVYLIFDYRVIRVWELNPEALLSGGLSLLPLTLIAAADPKDHPDLRRRMEARIDAELHDDLTAGDLWAATFILMGLRYNRDYNIQLLAGVRGMKESVTYQAILEEGRQEGRAEGELKALLVTAAPRLGEPSQETLAQLRAIPSVDRVETLLRRVHQVESWDDLLAD